jgi:hypothetical protein
VVLQGSASQFELLRSQQALQALAAHVATPQRWQADAIELLRQNRELLRIEGRGADGRIGRVVDSPLAPPLFAVIGRDNFDIEAVDACDAARRSAAPVFSRSYFVPLPDGRGQEVADLCVPLLRAGEPAGFLVGSFALHRVLDNVLAARDARRHEFSIVEGDGTRLARSGAARQRACTCRACRRPAGFAAAPACGQCRGLPAQPHPQPHHWPGAGPVAVPCSGWCCCWRGTCDGVRASRPRWPRRWPSARRWRIR